MHNSGNVYEKIKELINGEGTTLLDVGCGDGEFISKLPLWMRSYGCGYEKPKQNINFKRVDLNKDNIPFKTKFDIVTCMELIEHIENPFKLIRELSRVTKKNGVVVLSTPNVQSWYYRIYYMLTGKLIGFEQKDGYSFDHITPIHWHVFKKYIEEHFVIEKITTNRSIIPIFKFELPYENMFFSDSIIIKLRKK